MVLYTQIAKQRGLQLNEVRNLSIYDFYLILEDILLEQKGTEKKIDDYGQKGKP
jgi:hypothetical protein